MTVEVVRFTVQGADRDLRVTEQGRPYTVVFDGVCKMCKRLVGVLRRWDSNGHLELVPFQAPGVQARFPWIPPGSFSEAVQMVGPGGETWQGRAAIEQLLNVLPKGRLISWIFRLPYARTIGDKLYRWVAKNRYRLGCGEHCQYRPSSVSFGE
ncbi:MAG TPA: DUF393 domain-containing protein [Thermoanaerobaculia bacterium]|nr:DUF393 domain-containing protein [Thermoanaerobaculia bacterium]